LVTELRPLKNANLSKFSERRLKLIVAIHQPQYLPWLGYFDKIIKADAFCYLDNVQYKKNEWQNRNRIKTAQGRQWLTVPVSYRFPAKINEVKINNTVNWKRKHLQAMITNYSKAPFFAEYIGFFEEVYSKDWELISELNVYLIGRMQEMLNIKEKRTVLASTLSLSDDPTERLIDICKTLEGDTYLSGQDGAKYMDLERFKANGIEVIVQDFIHPEYPQLFGDFASHLSIVDLLFNCGPETLERIKACKR
jgi:WbqC-like protein family